VFVNPSVTDIEAREIMNHELVHVRQKHWFDLLLIELLCMMQWFNPLVWIYVRFIRQNHEYLADEVALQRTSDPAIYRAALLNQIVGAPVVSLANSFNYSLNKKRFNMMKNIISSPYRKMKVLLILPVFAIVLYSFAKPDYKYKIMDQNSGISGAVATQVQHEVKGTVVQKNGEPLPAANITLENTTVGTITDLNGTFKILVPDDGVMMVSFVGFRTREIKPDFKAPLKIVMEKDTVKYSEMNIGTPPPPPPPPPVSTILNSDGTPPLYVVDGTITTPADLEKIDPNSIERIDVLKEWVKKYGEKGKNGVVEVTTKKAIKGSSTSLPGVPPPPPPPPPASGIDQKDGEKPLIIIDGKLSDVDINKIDPATISSMNVLKDKSPTEKPATDKYGAKGKNGVIEITTKGDMAKALIVIDGVINDKKALDKIKPEDIKSMNVLKNENAVQRYGDKGKDGVIEVTTFKEGEKRPEANEKPFVVVEELPEFIGGKEAMSAWITSNLKYPAEAYNAKITGKVNVSFMVSKTGKIKNVEVAKSVNPALDAEAKRVISSMPDWKPGTQGGKGVDVQYMVPVEFKLN
jgi:TonB family protein